MDTLRNFRDFLQIYNLMSENCFNRCVNTFQSRDIAEDEMNCVDVCANKHVRVNHKMMSVYMEVQPLMMQKRMEEMEKLNPPVEQPTSETPVISDTPVVTEAPISSETSVEQSSSSVSANLNNSVETPVAS